MFNTFCIRYYGCIFLFYSCYNCKTVFPHYFFLLVSTFGFHTFLFVVLFIFIFHTFLFLSFSYFYHFFLFNFFMFCYYFQFVFSYSLYYYFRFFIIYNYQDILQGTSFPRSLSLPPFSQHNHNAKVRCLCL